MWSSLGGRSQQFATWLEGVGEGVGRYLTEDAVLQWFGRTVRGRRRVTAFLAQTRLTGHRFTHVHSCSALSDGSGDHEAESPCSPESPVPVKTPPSGLPSPSDVCRTPSPPAKRRRAASASPPRLLRGREGGGDAGHESQRGQRGQMEASCVLQFSHDRGRRGPRSRWERRCTLRAAYCTGTEDYVVRSLTYGDGSGCRRNLLSAFEAVAREESLPES